MSAYSTLENLLEIIPEAELVNLTNDEYPVTVINTSITASAIEYASQLVNAYLRNKYVLPLEFVPEIVIRLTTDIAAYRLYSRRPEKMPEHIKDNYDEAKRLLADIKKEAIILDLAGEHPENNVTPPGKMVVTNKTAADKIFGDEMWKGFGM